MYWGQGDRDCHRLRALFGTSANLSPFIRLSQGVKFFVFSKGYNFKDGITLARDTGMDATTPNRKATTSEPAGYPLAQADGLLVCSGFWPPCYGYKDCMAANVEHDAAREPDGDAARVLDYEPLAICENCPHVVGLE